MKKIFYFSILNLFLLSSCTTSESKPQITYPEYTSNQEVFKTKLSDYDSITANYTYKSTRTLISKSSANILSINVHISTAKELSKNVLAPEFEKVLAHTRSEISNYKQFDKIEVIFHNKNNSTHTFIEEITK